MSCGICSRDFGRRRQPTCASCSRAQIYNLRLEQILSLLGKEKLHGTIKTVLQPPSQVLGSRHTSSSQIIDLTESARKLELETHRGQIQSLDEKLAGIRLQQDILRQQIRKSRAENATRKEAHSRKREEIQTARQRLQGIRDTQLVQVEAECKQLVRRLERVQKHTISGRQRLCIETAYLFGLRRKKGRAIDGVTQPDSVYIGKLPIPDLRELNTVHPDRINAALTHVTRFLATTSHYLGVRLPAEVVPPHAGFPQAGIFSLSSSYNKRAGKIRHLYISKPLPLLAKDEVPVYNNFVDGLVLLAYDIAWLCRTQGLLEVDNLESLCTMGPNLYNLFLASRPENQHRVKEPKHADAGQLRLGAFSQATASGDPARQHVADLLVHWRLPSLASMVDKVRSHLLTEMTRAEWELLEEREWEEEREDERAVLVGGARWSLATGSASRMGISYMTAAQDIEEPPGKDESAKGWMKLKVRSGETKP